MLNIEETQYQYATPDKSYTVDTRNPEYKVQPEWHKYYAVDMRENYFVEDELEFLKQLREDLLEYAKQVDLEIQGGAKRHVRTLGKK